MVALPVPFEIDQPPGSALDREKSTAFLQQLPPLPTVAAKFLALMGKADINLKEINSLIASDGVLTAELLRVSNSAMFGGRGGVKNVLHALAILGTERVKGIVCTIALKNYLGNALQIPAFKLCWRHNLATAVVADEIASWSQADCGAAYTAGILHDIGRLALIALDASKYLITLDAFANGASCLLSLERAAYGMDHAEAGMRLSEMWGLPLEIQVAVGRHHEEPTGSPMEPPTIVNYSCRISDQLGFGVVATKPENVQTGGDPIQSFLDLLPPRDRERHQVKDLSQFQLAIASKVNALEN